MMVFTHPNRLRGPLPCLSVTFDDGFKTDYSEAFRLLRKKGVLGTTFTVTDWIGRAGRLSVSDIHYMRSKGWDFQCHTHTHPHLPQLTEQEVRAEYEAVDAWFASQGLPTPEHHAYPYGEYQGANVIVGDYRISARRTGARLPSSYGYDYCVILGNRQIGSFTGDLETETNYDVFCEWIDYLVENNLLGVTYWHEMNPARLRLLDKGLDYAIEKGVRILPYKQLYDLALERCEG